MKKRSGSLSPPLQDSKKMKHQPRGRDSPKKETVKKVKVRPFFLSGFPSYFLNFEKMLIGDSASAIGCVEEAEAEAEAEENGARQVDKGKWVNHKR